MNLEGEKIKKERKSNIRSRFLHLKQFKYPLSRIPVERIEELKQILHNQKEMTVYCDASITVGQPLAGLSACYVGGGMTIIESKKVYTQVDDNAVYAELQAVKHAIETIPKILLEYSRYSFNPVTIKIFSDVHIIEHFIYQCAGKKTYMRDLIVEINNLLDTLPSGINVTIQYIGDQKKQNIFHKASHNAARRTIGKK